MVNDTLLMLSWEIKVLLAIGLNILFSYTRLLWYTAFLRISLVMVEIEI